MGVIRCRGVGEQENKASMGIYCHKGHAFRPYGRGNFPRHDVLGGYVKTGMDGCRWVNIDADGCSGACGHEGNAKQQKNIRKYGRMTIFGNTCTLQENKANFGFAKNWSESIIWVNSCSQCLYRVVISTYQKRDCMQT